MANILTVCKVGVERDMSQWGDRNREKPVPAPVPKYTHHSLGLTPRPILPWDEAIPPMDRNGDGDGDNDRDKDRDGVYQSLI